ncbi:fumarate hydratase [Alkalibacter saccharofermentans]|uniref:Fumarate hydratase subunit alpha n=1 Tax=Alkalibacter saccharofermentans DSM 14828 TaxID=1120975 RepID=A0A1M4T9T7_9FIRM|nr:fumarate hydratase [Alkalibacter saccharofermentans]SHE41007.1 fumarate hydratase subunit alpha [Alkalibacter saccharofermentans DSM 14828]
MREIHIDEIKIKVYDALLQINCVLSPDVSSALIAGVEREESEVGRSIFEDILKNNEIAKDKKVPICQDTGMVTAFVKVGQAVHVVGGNISRAINQAVKEAYKDGYFRKSVVSDPIERKNTQDNTPAVIHYDIVEGEGIEIALTAKGFGSENMSRLKMLKPSEGVEGVVEFITETVALAGPNACPPLFLGIGIGGTMEKCALLSKQALLRDADEPNPNQYYADLEDKLLERLNRLGIGPMGLGGTTSVLGVNIETFPTHIAGLPVAVNICCHVNRHIKVKI